MMHTTNDGVTIEVDQLGSGAVIIRATSTAGGICAVLMLDNEALFEVHNMLSAIIQGEYNG